MVGCADVHGTKLVPLVEVPVAFPHASSRRQSLRILYQGQLKFKMYVVALGHDLHSFSLALF